MPRRIVIIGAHAAGIDAASAARKTDRTAEITLITKQAKAGYSPCGIPFVLGRHIPHFDNLVVFPPAYYRMMKLNLRLETTATNIDTEAKTVKIEDKTGKQETLHYDSLIITTGAYPFVPPIKGRENKGVYALRTIKDGEETDIDCGGSTCYPCADGKKCIIDRDCINLCNQTTKICYTPVPIEKPFVFRRTIWENKRSFPQYPPGSFPKYECGY